MAQALDRAVVAQERQEAERHVAEDRPDLGCVAGVDAAGTLAEDDRHAAPNARRFSMPHRPRTRAARRLASA